MCIALTAASWDIKTAHIIQYKVTAYFMDFLFHLLCRRGERVSQQRSKDFNQSLNINGAFHQHIYKGEMHIKCDSTSTHPTVKRFFGSEQLDFSNPNMNTSVSMTLKRAYYSIQFVTDELAPGDSIKIKAADVAPFYLLYSKDGTSRTEERIISMYDISDYYTAKLKEEETIAFTISYRPANEEKWYSLYTNQSIKMKRNKRT